MQNTHNPTRHGLVFSQRIYVGAHIWAMQIIANGSFERQVEQVCSKETVLWKVLYEYSMFSEWSSLVTMIVHK